ncbi:MAG TPA: hypothetical protein PK176_16135 [Acidobacteriota bacterium]|nr:hypothetical protein [Acidobacteriota bacterium]HQM64843.1 hypothetical protein [Acidobacteriota bacterium]
MPDFERLKQVRERPVAPFYRGTAAALGLILAAALLAGCTESRVHVADRPLLVTKQDLAGFGIDPDTLQGQEIFRRNQYFDGSLEVEYAFETPDGAAEVFYINTVVGFENSVADAVDSYRLLKGGIGVGTQVGGGSLREVPDFYRWGDESYCAVVPGRAGPAGNVFLTRRGKKTFLVAIVGIYFDDSKAWDVLVRPKLEYLDGYTPRDN